MFAEQPVGNGPFYFDGEWVAQQYARFISFEDHFNGAPKVNVKISEIKDGNTALLAMQNGELDFLLSSQLEIVQQAEAWERMSTSSLPHCLWFILQWQCL